MFACHAATALTPRQFVILQAVAEANGLSQTGIMSATGIDRSSTAALVRRLVTYGWLKRRRTKRDTRVYAVRLTPEGRRVLALAIPAATATEKALLSSVSSHNRRKELLAHLPGPDRGGPPDTPAPCALSMGIGSG